MATGNKRSLTPEAPSSVPQILERVKELARCLACRELASVPMVCPELHLLCSACCRSGCKLCKSRDMEICRLLGVTKDVTSAEELKTRLLCAICGKVSPDRRVFSCTLGHVSCDRCWPHNRNANCASCQENGLERCRIYPQLLKILLDGKRMCMFFHYGCQETYYLPGISPHQKQCQFRQLACIDHPRCLWYGVARELDQHLGAQKCVQVNK